MKGRILVRSQCCWHQRQAGCWDAKEARRTRVPLVPIHSWSCSSLKVSLTFPPDLLYMPDKGTVGRRSWRHKSTVRKGGMVAQTEGDDTELQATSIAILHCELSPFQGLKKLSQLTWAPLTDGITSSGFPLSNTFLCCYNISHNREKMRQLTIFEPAFQLLDRQDEALSKSV